MAAPRILIVTTSPARMDYIGYATVLRAEEPAPPYFAHEAGGRA